MFGLSKNHTYPIGVDIGDDILKLAQLKNNGKGLALVATAVKDRPSDIEPGSVSWQKWAIETLRELTTQGFHGRDVIASVPVGEVYLDHIKMPKTKQQSSNTKKHSWATLAFAKLHHDQTDPDDKTREAVLSKIQSRLPFDSDQAMIRCIPGQGDNALVIATQREKINRHLAIFEDANLQIKSICVWPVALANAYVRFFGRRQTDIETVVILLDIEQNFTNVVICRHKNLLFARSIPTGAKQLETEEMMAKLVSELNACRRHFASTHKNTQIERLIFMSSHGSTALNNGLYTSMAKQLEMPAQLGDCFAAVDIENPAGLAVDRRQCKNSWAVAFGLSLP